MLHVTKVNCFIFACSHPSSVKKVRRTKPKYIYAHQMALHKLDNKYPSLLIFLQWKEQNEFHLSFSNGHSEFKFFT